jgi:ABC-2 type transport system ATP-binding protein
MNVLSYGSVTKVYRRSHLGRVTETRALTGLDLEVSPGEIVGLLGLNGAGKTTTIKLALGLLFPTAGEVRVCGLSARDPQALGRVGYLPEFPYFYSYMTPREALRFYGRLSGVSDRELEGRIDAVLARVGLSKQRDREIAGFSKGMLQKVGLSQAILHRPDLLLLDEPVSGLDPLAVAEMRELLLSLNQEGKTLFFSSHSISEVERISHRVAILVDGRREAGRHAVTWDGRDASGRAVSGGLYILRIEAGNFKQTKKLLLMK